MKQFEVKFNVDEHAWFMKDNKPIEVIISAIQIFYVKTNQDCTKYNAKNVTNSVSWLDHQNLFEEMLFKTKGELLKSLFGNGRTCEGKNCNAINGVDHSDECIQEHEQCYAGEAQDMIGFEGTTEQLGKIGINRLTEIRD